MFSGIVETTGLITFLEVNNGCKHFSITPAYGFDDISIGDSISVNGVCLTVTHLDDASFNVTAVPETLRLTNLDDLSVNDPVNLERSLKVGQRISGHFVQGHIDNVGHITEVITDQKSEAWLVKINIPKNLAPYIVNKGYITIDGMSITVIQAKEDWLTVTFIPHTQAVTIVKHYEVGTRVNIEVDMLGKYLEKLYGVYAHAQPH
jgi:riboflavin synthase